MKDSKRTTNTTYLVEYFYRSYVLAIIGAIILVFGFFLLWIGLSFNFVVYIIGTAVAPAGLVLFIIGTIKRVSDDRIERFMDFQLAGQDIEIDTDKSYHLKLLENSKEIVIEGYKFHEGVMIKKLVSCELRSSEFSRSKIRILKDRIYIYNREISLINDDVKNTIIEPTFDKIISVEIVRDRQNIIFDKTEYLAKTCHLVITTTDSVIALPCLDAITTDEIPQKILKQRDAYLESLTNDKGSSV